jgi:hypothetical protein
MNSDPRRAYGRDPALLEQARYVVGHRTAEELELMCTREWHEHDVDTVFPEVLVGQLL